MNKATPPSLLSQICAPQFRRLDVRGTHDINALRDLSRPLSCITASDGGPISAVSAKSLTTTPPANVANALTLAPEDGDAIAMTIRVPDAVFDALDVNRVGGADAATLQLEIALESLMNTVDAAFGTRMELRTKDPSATHAYWRAFDVTLVHNTTHQIWIGADNSALPALAAAIADWPSDIKPCAHRLPTSVRIGKTVLSQDAVCALQHGDVILPAPKALSLARGHLALNHHIIAAVTLSDGTATLTEDPDMAQQDTENRDDGRLSSDGASPLDGLPVHVDFCLTGRDMPLDDVRKLAEGSVIPLELDADAPLVDLRVGGRMIGRGEVVDIAGRLAVQIIQVGS